MRSWDARTSGNTDRIAEKRSPQSGRKLRGAPAMTLLPREALMRALWRQRAYADRTGVPFVFVHANPTGPGSRAADDTWPNRFARAVCGLCRSSDVAGWYGEKGGDVGIILPDASPPGALRVVRGLEAIFRAEARAHATSPGAIPEIAYELFVYPGTAFSAVVDWSMQALEAERNTLRG